ncbi:type II secretion system protein GspK [uncultured Ilyobacter sp.]|uniref:type II secretion system protein GspK n=1 Tax=uncultured Ilyobacter sp. TaxID=544433 RepID=UPI0029F5B6AE|nr:type II secretion system protein GspK [uncultured Ilyobacter sp.]
MSMLSRRAVILPVVLIMIALLSLTMAGFIFFVRAETQGIMAFTDGHQARLAAESGFQELVSLLREDRDSAALWYDNPDRFRHALVWGRGFNRDSDPLEELASRREFFERYPAPAPAWRYSIVAPRYDGVRNTMRFGITPESAKLNLNHASDEQIEQLVTPLLVALEIENAPELVAAILDWRDTDDETREGGAENDYYNALNPGPPYNAKNGPFDTVEELLLVRGITAAILYGEDVNRNGILDENEDDGADSFPYYDNADGILQYGIAPFLTVVSREIDASLDNRARLNLNADSATLQAQIAAYAAEDELRASEGEEEDVYEEPLSDESLAFILSIAGNQNVVGQMRSPADFYVGAEELDPNEALPAELTSSPVQLEELPYILDHFSTRAVGAAQQAIYGLININAASSNVLMTIPNMTEDAAAAIVSGRDELLASNPMLLRTTAWPLAAEYVDAGTFRAIAPYITTKAYQFHVEIIGYADHRKIARRLEWIIEMVGPLAQIKYHRDLTGLGLAWPIDEEQVTVVTD